MSDPAREPAPFLCLKGIHKRFGGVHALRGVDLTIEQGKAYHLLGENGCGKSTIIKVISGAHAPTEGEIHIDGNRVEHLTPMQAMEAGIETVYQDLSLLPNLSVAENISLGEQLVAGKGQLLRRIDRRRMMETANAALRELGLKPDRAFLSLTVSDLPLAMRQRVAIARAIAAEARLAIMDEPTTSLTRHEVEALIEAVEHLLSRDVAVLFVTHKLEESYRIGGEAIVLRDGLSVAQGDLGDYSRAELAELMTGRAIESVRYRQGYPESAVLLRAAGITSTGHAFREVDFSLHRGEILGITGLSDSGRNELALALAGHVDIAAGRLELAGCDVRLPTPAAAIEAGIGYVPEDRLSEGLFLEKSIWANEVPLILNEVSNTAGLIDAGKARSRAREISERMKLNTEDVDLPVGALSGGNQQRVLIGRWLSIEPQVLILHGPTVGVDVGSKETIFRAMQSMAEQGIGVLVVSDDLPELLQNCDRILVMNAGRIVETLAAETATEDEIYRSMLASENEAA